MKKTLKIEIYSKKIHIRTNKIYTGMERTKYRANNNYFIQTLGERTQANRLIGRTNSIPGHHRT